MADGEFEMTGEMHKRLTEASKELFSRKEPVKFELDMTLTVGLIGHLQLAFRHPQNNGPTRDALEKFVLELIEKIDPFKGDAYEFLMLGYNGKYDSIFCQNCQEDVSIVDGFCECCMEKICPHCGCTDSEPCLDGCSWMPSGFGSACEDQFEADFIE